MFFIRFFKILIKKHDSNKKATLWPKLALKVGHPNQTNKVK